MKWNKYDKREIKRAKCRWAGPLLGLETVQSGLLGLNCKNMPEEKLKTQN